MLLKYNDYIKESFSFFKFYDDKEELEKDRESLKDLLDIIDRIELDEIKYFFIENNYPKEYVKFYKCLFKLFKNDEFELKYSELLLLNSMINKSLENEELSKKYRESWFEDFNKKKKELEKMVPGIIGISLKEFDKLSSKFKNFIDKYKENKESSIKISETDPYGEEEWDDSPESEKIRKAWEEN